MNKRYVELRESLEKFFEEAKKSVAIQYKSISGITYTEEPGTYNEKMVRAMAGDMLVAHHAINAIDANLGKITQSWFPKMSTHNTELSRRIDDYKGDRPMKAPMYKRALKFAAEIEDIGLSDVIAKTKLEGLETKFQIWSDRLLYQNVWEYTLRQRCMIKNTQMEASIQEYDCNGVHTGGLSKEDEQNVKELCSLRLELLNAYLKIPVRSPLSEECRKRSEMLTGFTDAIMEDWDSGDNEKHADNTEISFKEASKLEDNQKDLSELLTAISVVAKTLKSETETTTERRCPSEPEIKEMLTTLKVIIERAEYKLEQNKDGSCGYLSGVVNLIRRIADNIELYATN